MKVFHCCDKLVCVSSVLIMGCYMLIFLLFVSVLDVGYLYTGNDVIIQCFNTVGWTLVQESWKC